MPAWTGLWRAKAASARRTFWTATLSAGLIGGCAQSDARVALVERIRGIDSVRYDGLDLVIEKSTSGEGADWTMIGPQGPADVAVLRLGKEFVLTDSTTFIATYRVMSLDEDVIGFRKTTRLNGQARGEAERESSTVIHVRTYED